MTRPQPSAPDPGPASGQRAAGVRPGLHPADDDWPERLRRASAESWRRRVERADARRDRALRRRKGLEARHGWRQARRDARAARPD